MHTAVHPSPRGSASVVVIRRRRRWTERRSFRAGRVLSSIYTTFAGRNGEVTIAGESVVVHGRTARKMPPKKREKDLDGQKGPRMDQIQADHELFLQAFESERSTPFREHIARSFRKRERASLLYHPYLNLAALSRAMSADRERRAISADIFVSNGVVSAARTRADDASRRQEHVRRQLRSRSSGRT